MTQEMFDQPGPAQGDSFEWSAHQGRLLMIEVIEVIDHVPTVHTQPGEKSPAIRANITLIDGLLVGKVARDALVFPKVLQGQLRRSVGRKVLGRLGQGTPTPGKSAAWELAEATPADVAAAQAFLANRAANGMAAPAPATSQPPF